MKHLGLRQPPGNIRIFRYTQAPSSFSPFLSPSLSIKDLDTECPVSPKEEEEEEEEEDYHYHHMYINSERGQTYFRGDHDSVRVNMVS